MLKFNQFYEKVKLRDTGIPREYMRNVEREAEQKARESHFGPEEGDRFQHAIEEMIEEQHGHEEELTELARKVIYEHYEAILDNVNLDITITSPEDNEEVRFQCGLLRMQHDHFGL